MAWVSTVHVADDANGEGYGMAHYAVSGTHRLRPSNGAACAYGPSEICTIDTRHRFHVAFEFGTLQPFGFTTTLSQGERTAVAGPIAYSTKPTKGDVPTAAMANDDLRRRLGNGMTLVTRSAGRGWIETEGAPMSTIEAAVAFHNADHLFTAGLHPLSGRSYWAGGAKRDMGWLDAPCGDDEVEGWGCTDAWVEHPDWSWLCAADDVEPPLCSPSFTLTDVAIHAPNHRVERADGDGAASGLATSASACMPDVGSSERPPPSFEAGFGIGFGCAFLMMAIMWLSAHVTRRTILLRGAVVEGASIPTVDDDRHDDDLNKFDDDEALHSHPHERAPLAQGSSTQRHDSSCTALVQVSSALPPRPLPPRRPRPPPPNPGATASRAAPVQPTAHHTAAVARDGALAAVPQQPSVPHPNAAGARSTSPIQFDYL